MSGATARVFRGCRALLAPAPAARSSSAGAAAAAATTKSPSKSTQKPKTASLRKPKSPPRTMVRPTGILKVAPVSPALGAFLGANEASRSDAVKQIWSYIKTHNLQNPRDKREIFCDEKLKALFGGKEKVGFLEIGKLLAQHFVKTN
ncbi:hypothetical protein SLEP1_g54178 [Rubroshorea leprosula]|uniref:DM2 domain-containing protein n=1 Tax=Rubroshorea leprosula TaxID=152421 RepID=A0AAV5MDI5_9ROSI|nr:hypothetical protein SLEP1_g54178 [Rubroshorea leprosula]